MEPFLPLDQLPSPDVIGTRQVPATLLPQFLDTSQDTALQTNEDIVQDPNALTMTNGSNEQGAMVCFGMVSRHRQLAVESL